MSVIRPIGERHSRLACQYRVPSGSGRRRLGDLRARALDSDTDLPELQVEMPQIVYVQTTVVQIRHASFA